MRSNDVGGGRELFHSSGHELSTLIASLARSACTDMGAGWASRHAASTPRVFPHSNRKEKAARELLVKENWGMEVGRWGEKLSTWVGGRRSMLQDSCRHVAIRKRGLFIGAEHRGPAHFFSTFVGVGITVLVIVLSCTRNAIYQWDHKNCSRLFRGLILFFFHDITTLL